ncbi:alpha-L-fucosidase [Pedobacter sp. ok626]|nr:alpha-L-fucosidase [Pedobacter sp. ok626]
MLTFICVFWLTSLHMYAQTRRSPAGEEVPERKTIKLPGGKAKDIPEGPYKPTWESVKENYQVPEWWKDGKFGIFIHWGLYAVPAYQSEWYSKHMYGNEGIQKRHVEKYGPVDKFGYKDFIPMFTADKFKPKAWAELFRKAGARYIVPTAEHHDGFAMYESDLTKWDAKDMGPHRDLIGELAKAVRNEGLKFGVSNHRMENWNFMYPALATKSDLFDPAYADFYGPPQPTRKREPAAGIAAGDEVMNGLDAPQSQAFLEEWLRRCQELVDKYQPDMFWFDNGVNGRAFDPIKLRFAAYYYNSASKWKKQVSISTKSDAYLYGSIKDFERQGRAPKELTDYGWQVDDPVLSRFGYTENSLIVDVNTVVTRLIENVSRNGALLLNISPKADGTIPDDQQKLLLQIGGWLDVNGEAIYATRAWKKFGEGNFRFTTKGNILYAISLKSPEETAILESLPASFGKVSRVSLLGQKENLTFVQNEKGLKIDLSAVNSGSIAWAFKIEGLDLKQ